MLKGLRQDCASGLFPFLLRTGLRDSPKGPPTANRHQPPTATNRQPPSTANHYLVLPHTGQENDGPADGRHTFVPVPTALRGRLWQTRSVLGRCRPHPFAGHDWTPFTPVTPDAHRNTAAPMWTWTPGGRASAEDQAQGQPLLWGRPGPRVRRTCAPRKSVTGGGGRGVT